MESTRDVNTSSGYGTETEDRETTDENEAPENESTSGVKYLVFGREVGESGTRHLQGYIELSERIRFNGIRRLLNRAHIEPRRGSSQQAAEYCKKDGLWEEFGSISKPHQGTRSDLEELRVSIQSGSSLRSIADEHFGCFIKYQRGINAARTIYSSKRTWITNVHVYWGKTGLGKTRKVYEEVGDVDLLYIHPGGPWFDGYDGQPNVLFDDYGGHEFKLTYFLKLLDRYPFTVPVKGAFASWVPKNIYITANHNPNNWYSNASPEHVAAMLRRITEIIHME